MSNQLAVRENGNGLAVYGGSEEIKTLANRIKIGMPGGRRYSDEESLALAQLSLAHQLDPFNGEAWLIPGSGLMVGIKGLRKHARRASNQENGTYWIDLQRVEPSKYTDRKGAVVYECHLRDTVTMQAWGKSVNILTSAGVRYEDAVKACGPAPVVIGIGVAYAEEKSKMEIHQRARKRAEADAIKQRYDVQFGNAEFSEEEPDTIEAEFTPVITETPQRSPAQILNELGYDEPPESEYIDVKEQEIKTQPARPYSPADLKAQLDAWSFEYQDADCSPKHRQVLASALNNTVGGDDNRHAVLRYLTGETSTKDIAGAYVLAMLKSWLTIRTWDDGPHPDAITEARAVLHVATVSSNQPELL